MILQIRTVEMHLLRRSLMKFQIPKLAKNVINESACAFISTKKCEGKSKGPEQNITMFIG